MTHTPEFANYVRVDVVIECWSVMKTTTEALLQAMPDAYGGELPGEDDWPEPDAKRDRPYMLARVWDKLTPEVQADILASWAMSWGRA